MTQDELEAKVKKILTALASRYPDAVGAMSRAGKGFKAAEDFLANVCKVHIEASVPLYDADIQPDTGDRLCYENTGRVWQLVVRFAGNATPKAGGAISPALRAIALVAVPRLLEELHEQIVGLEIIADVAADEVEKDLADLTTARKANAARPK